jgi:hypothetical protein
MQEIIYRILMVIVAIILVTCSFFGNIGVIFLLIGLLSLVIAKIMLNRSIFTFLPDIVYGMVDTGSLVVFIYIGATFAGIFGAVVSAVICDAITDSLGGAFEGKIDELLRKRSIDTTRMLFSSSIGKLSGCLIGGGIVLMLLGYCTLV